MRRRNARPSTPEENRARNRARIMNPPAPTRSDRIRRRIYAVQDLWRRHVSQRKLTRLLDRALLVPLSYTEQDSQAGRERFLAKHPGPHPQDAD